MDGGSTFAVRFPLHAVQKAACRHRHCPTDGLKNSTEITVGLCLFYCGFGAGAVVVGAAGATAGAITRGAPDGVWPVVVPGVELLEVGVELLIAPLVPQGPNSISAPAITTAAIIAA